MNRREIEIRKEELAQLLKWGASLRHIIWGCGGNFDTPITESSALAAYMSASGLTRYKMRERWRPFNVNDVKPMLRLIKKKMEERGIHVRPSRRVG